MAAGPGSPVFLKLWPSNHGQLVNPARQARKALRRQLSEGESKPVSAKQIKRLRQHMKRGSA